MNTDLVGAAGFGEGTNEGEMFVHSEHVKFGDGFFSGGDNGHFFAVRGVASDRGGEEAGTGCAVANGEVGFRHSPRGKLFDQSVVNGRGFGCDQNSRGVFVETMHNTGSQRAVGDDGLAVRQECVDKGARRVARGGVDDHACGFVHSEQKFILVEHIEGDRFGGQREFRSELETDFDFVILFGNDPFFHLFSVHQHEPFLKKPLEVGSRVLGVAGGQKLIDANI